jgi:hypothetical protein
LEQDRLRHRFAYVSAVAVAVAAITIATATARVIAAFGYVGQQCELTRALDGARDLALMTTAGSGDPTRTDFPAIGDEPAQGRNIFVVDLLDLVPAVRARLPAGRSRPAFPVAPAYRSSALLSHWDSA